MRFALLFGMTDESWSHIPPEETARVDAEIAAWWQAKVRDGTIVHGADLGASTLAKTIRRTDGQLAVVDGPFTVGADVLGGYAIVEVDDVERAIALAKTWPALQVVGESVEVRPLNG
ncbi:MAG: YciI family protein [Actinomycetes bacterium]